MSHHSLNLSLSPNCCYRSGGHLGSSLGVIELTIALHYTFEAPDDKILFDVGHQAYPHKILTGRRSRMKTLRQTGGLSGFTKRGESPYDPFGAGHSSTTPSAALGMAVGRSDCLESMLSRAYWGLKVNIDDTSLVSRPLFS